MPLGHKTKMNKLENRYFEGFYLGMRKGSDEAYIGLAEGPVVKARAVKRLSLPEQRDGEGLKKIKGAPWKPSA
eukprot:16437113-Heterocapsa_arctica.AAC.1